MFGAALWTLRQPRYAALAVTTFVLAAFCVGAGVFELHRYHEKHDDNAQLRANATGSVVALTPTIAPLTGSGSAPGVLDISYRAVAVTGRYLSDQQTYLDDQSQGGKQGFYVLTPLRTADGVVVVARGFVAADSEERRPASVADAPGGVVSVVGRLQSTSTEDDQYRVLARAELTSVNAQQQAARIGAPVYQAYLALNAGQPGGAGLTALPRPPLDNPTGGAAQWQLLSYVVQWWVFALLLLLAPFAICRVEVREARMHYLGLEEVTEFDLQVAEEVPALSGGPIGVLEAGGPDSGGALVLRSAGSLVRPGGVSAEQWERASRMADRYGRSLGPQDGRTLVPKRLRRVGYGPVRTSATEPHRSEGDDYHALYNDYLWQLALRDGDVPVGPDLDGPDRAAVGGQVEKPAPRVIDLDEDR